MRKWFIQKIQALTTFFTLFLHDTRASVNKWIVETLVLGLAVGGYMYYGQEIVDNLAAQFGMEPSSYLYATLGFCIIVIASLIGKAVTRGMK